MLLASAGNGSDLGEIALLAEFFEEDLEGVEPHARIGVHFPVGSVRDEPVRRSIFGQAFAEVDGAFGDDFARSVSMVAEQLCVEESIPSA